MIQGQLKLSGPHVCGAKAVNVAEILWFLLQAVESFSRSTGPQLAFPSRISHSSRSKRLDGLPGAPSMAQSDRDMGGKPQTSIILMIGIPNHRQPGTLTILARSKDLSA